MTENLVYAVDGSAEKSALASAAMTISSPYRPEPAPRIGRHRQA